MCEESACLVPPLEAAQNGPTEQRRRMLLQLTTFSMPTSFAVSPGTSNHSYSGEALVGFHEDALTQAAVGKAQLLLAFVLGLGLAAECLEFTILGFLLPAAEVQLCIDEHRKGWLISITLLAMAGGSLAWGILGDYLGRRRALISALSVGVLFSAVASVMPTYGLFMTARFCSGLGVSGAFPLTFSYLAETCCRSTRARYTGLLSSMWPFGAIFISIIAHFTTPTLGADIVQDNREHWSSWHRFLILSTLPSIFCIIGLTWASESPRYLLEASREVEALAVYQKLHRLNKARTIYGLTELELPPRSAYRERPSPSRNLLNTGFASFRQAFQRVSSPTHFRTTLKLAAIHFLLGFYYMSVISSSSMFMKDIRDQDYFLKRKYIKGEIYTGIIFNNTLENIQYSNTIFKNVTFTHMNLNHVEFVNCNIEDSEFLNVKASVTYFKESLIKDSRFVDTDVTVQHFINCSLINNIFLSLTFDCSLYFDYNIYLDELYEENMMWACLMIPFLLITGFIMEARSRTVPIWMTVLMSGMIAILGYKDGGLFLLLAIRIVVRLSVMCSVTALSLIVLEEYPCHLRCTAHGLMRCIFHIASLCAIPIYSKLAHTFLVVDYILIAFMIMSIAFLASNLQDNSKVLL